MATAAYHAKWRKKHRPKLRVKARQYYDTVVKRKKREERAREIEWMNAK